MKQVDLLGLWKACLNFEGNKGFEFSTFAYSVIQNEINGYLRQNKKHINAISINEKNKDGLVLEDVLSDEIEDINFEKSRLCEAINELENREKEIIKLKISGFTQTEIAKKIGISQPHVSRIIKKVRYNYEKMCV